MILSASCAKVLPDDMYQAFIAKYVPPEPTHRGRPDDPMVLRALVGGLVLAYAYQDKLLLNLMHRDVNGLYGRKVKKALERLGAAELVTYDIGKTTFAAPLSVPSEKKKKSPTTDDGKFDILQRTLTEVVMTPLMLSAGMVVSGAVRGRNKGQANDPAWLSLGGGKWQRMSRKRKRGNYVCLCGIVPSGDGVGPDMDMPHYGTALRGDYFTLLEEVARFNAFMRRHRITYWHYDATGKWVETPICSDVHKLFSHLDIADFGGDRLGLGGRYNDEDALGWQRVESELRRNFNIDGEETAEIDFSGMNPAIIAALAGVVDADTGNLYAMDMSKFPGVDPAFMRSTIKLMIAIYMNCDTMYAAGVSFADIIDATGTTTIDGVDVVDQAEVDKMLALRKCLDGWGQLSAMYIQQHRWMEPFMGHGVWGLRCQRFESDIMSMVMARAILRDVPLLPIHDGLLCRKRDAEWLRGVMESCFTELLGGKAVVKIVVGK